MSPSSLTDPAAFPHIHGYTITEQLYVGSRTAVYRAISDSRPDSKPSDPTHSVVLKIMRQLHPDFSDLLHFRNQYTIAQNLPISGIVRPLSLEQWKNGYALVMEDFGGLSLHQYTKAHSLTLTEILSVAVQLTDVLHELAQHRVVHKDIKPANILIHPISKQIKLIDFSLASLLPKEIQESQHPSGLEGTLAYIAPEQTGRMNRGIDYRSDFYSFGITLYELLTGQLPFATRDALELVHCHIAKMPAAPHQLNADIPVAISQIVLKLMAKNAEDRYQSALGLKHDLEKCLIEWKETGSINEFELAQQDACDHFLIPEKLYGREEEVKNLLAAFDRVSQGSSEMMLVAGFSGIGKTAVINEVHKPITRQHGYFIKGKFDQFNRDIPFSAFVQAFRSLMAQLLSESDEQLNHWKEKILAAIGENGQVIIDVIPELVHIIGEHPPAPKLSGSAAQNRFNLLFKQFVQVFALKEHPLVFFLDDLQWADSASLALLKLLVTESNTGYLLALGAYRDNEVFSAHPLMLTLEEVKAEGATLNSLTLSPLTQTHVDQLVAETLQCDSTITAPLSELIYRKTQGNPFFTTQFLTGLYEDDCITFDPEVGYWQCDLTQVRQNTLIDDVVEFMVRRLQKLPEQTQQVIKLAACIGNRFDLDTLAIICGLHTDAIAANLWAALQEGFVIPESETYKFFQGETHQAQRLEPQPVGYRFFHDRIQQAAYALIPNEQKQQTHLKIGQLLQDNLSEQAQQQQLFEIVNQLNLGRESLEALPEATAKQQQLAQLNLQAGKKAKQSAAYQAAQNYCSVGIALLPTSAWQTHYALMYGLHREGAEAAYLAGDFKKAEALYGVAIAQAKTPLDKAVIYRIQVTQYQLQGRNGEAVGLQRQSLALLDWEMPETPEAIQASLDRQIEAVGSFLKQRSIDSILELDKMEDDSVAEMLRILQILFYTAWLDGQPGLALLALAKMTSLSLQYGNSEMSPFGYAGYGLIANIILKNATMADRFGAMAVALCEQFDNADVTGMTNFLFAADVHSWSRPLRSADLYYDTAFKASMEAGNWLTVSFVIMLSGSDRLTYGKDLEDLYAIAQPHAEFLTQIKSFDNLDAFTAGVLQPVRHLLGLTQSPLSFDDDSFSEAQYLEKYAEAPYHLVWFYSVKIRHAYLFEQVSDYLELISKLSIIENTVATHAKVPSSVFYVALMHLALIDAARSKSTEPLEQLPKQQPEHWPESEHWQAMLQLEERLTQWNKDCPENIHHKLLLIQAEKARLNSQPEAAIALYKQSAKQAKQQGYGYEAALANERLAKFYQQQDNIEAAAQHMQAAYYGYGHWKAKTKVKQLKNRYPQLLQPILASNSTASANLFSGESITALGSSHITMHTSTRASTTNLNASLDLAAVLKASQAISSTIELNELLKQLTTIILQNSGGDRCALLLPDTSGTWQMRAITTPENTTLCLEPLEGNSSLPVQLIQYVKNTQKTVLIENLATDSPVIDTYLQAQSPQSTLCLPLHYQSKLIGILYLSNQATRGVFTQDKLLVLNLLCTQAAISLENARLHKIEQKKAKQLERSEANLRNLYERAADPILLLGEKAFVDCNRAAVELFEANSKEQLCTSHPADISPKLQADGQASFDKAQTMMKKGMENGSHRFEWQHQTLTGRVFWAEVVLTPLRYKDEMVLHSIVRDISDRKATEASVQQKTQELKQA
ncbi:MAG: AAA family ATPase, partial [Cyanobacteria bacterium P01_D01_bin.105]